METFFKQPKKKRRNKHRHITNARFTEWTGCWVCEFLYGPDKVKGAYATHEVFYKGASWIRNKSIEYGAQIPVCMEHDEEIHRSGSNLGLRIKRHFQRQLMEQHGWTIADFFHEFGENYLDEDWEWTEEGI